MHETTEPKFLLLGSTGQVGWELRRALVPLGQVQAPSEDELDLRHAHTLRAAVRRVLPDVIVNAAAYTAVDRAEEEPEIAEAINAEGPALLAEEAKRTGAILVHYSTDYVFDGMARLPYTEESRPSPLGVYARTKLAGERAVLSAGVDGYVFRLSWVYGLRGSNFLRTIRRLLAEGREVRVVADQFGSPTWCRVVAEATAQVVCQILRSRSMGSTPPSSGIYHMTGPDHTTWHGFAEAIVGMGKSSAEAGGVRVVPISTSDFPTTAIRPKYSVLDSSRLARTFGLRLPPWREQLELCLGYE